MSCRILIQIKKAGEETSIKDYYKHAGENLDIDYKNLLTLYCDNIQVTRTTIIAEIGNKRFKAFELEGQPSQPYQKGVVYNEVALTDEAKKELNTDSTLTSWIYIECQ